VMGILIGIAGPVTMAAKVAEKRPALRSMIYGNINLHHARQHSAKWVDQKQLDPTSPLTVASTPEHNRKETDRG